ncbi:MAG: YCF48-related protein [Bacteroidota bacterium]
MKCYTFLLFFLFSLTGFAQFEVINTGVTATLEDVYFIDENVGIAVGDSGTIIRSTDSGLNWNTVMNEPNVQFQAVGFFDELHGIASGNHTYITDDGGETWSLSLESPGSNFYTDLEIISPTTCLVSNYSIGLMKSTDQGETWETLIPSPGNFQYRQMTFINESIGFSYSELGPPFESVLKTTDGGLNWDTIVSDTPWNNTVLEDMIFLDENIGYQLGWYNGHFLKTTDGGDHWYQPEISDNITTQLYDFDIHPDRPNSYYACGWYGEILKSTDGGESWERIDNDIAESNGLKSIYFHNDTLGWVVGGMGMILRTTTGGEILSTKSADEIGDITVYPNPATDQLYIDISKYSGEAIEEIRVFDLQGKQVNSFRWNTYSNSLDLGDLPQGQYQLQFINDGVSVLSKKVIVTK